VNNLSDSGMAGSQTCNLSDPNPVSYCYTSGPSESERERELMFRGQGRIIAFRSTNESLICPFLASPAP